MKNLIIILAFLVHFLSNAQLVNPQVASTLIIGTDVTQNTTFTSSSPIGTTAYATGVTIGTITIGKAGNHLKVDLIYPPVGVSGTPSGDYILAIDLDSGTPFPLTSINQAGVNNLGAGGRLNASFLLRTLTAGVHTINFRHKVTASNSAGNTFTLAAGTDRPFTICLQEVAATN